MNQNMRAYQQQELASASPHHLILKLYDLGIAACHKNDAAKVRAVIVELISSINFEAGGELAQRLFGLYEYCLNELSKGNVDEAKTILTDLRSTWKKGMVSSQAA